MKSQMMYDTAMQASLARAIHEVENVSIAYKRENLTVPNELYAALGQLKALLRREMDATYG